MRVWFILIAAMVLAGCSSHRAPPPNPRLADSITVVANLNEQLRNWRGAPYRYGGMTPRGVDCSGFVVRTFRDKFAMQLRGKLASRRKSAPVLIKAICCPATWCSSKPAPAKAACTSVSMIPTINLFTPPPVRA